MMTKPDNTKEDTLLEALFADERAAEVGASEALMARIMQDGAAAQVQAKVARAKPRKSRSFWADLGGWPAFASLGAAALAGVWIGVINPAPVEAAVGLLNGAANESYLVGFTAEPELADVFEQGESQ